MAKVDVSKLSKPQRAVLKRVVKTPRTASEIGKPLGYSGRGAGKVLSFLVKKRLVVKTKDRPASYHTK